MNIRDQVCDIFKALYSITKYCVGLNYSKTTKPIQYLLILITFIVIIVGVLLTSILYIIATVVDVYLRLKYGKKYGGMLKGLDSVMTSTEKLIAINIPLLIARNGSYVEFENDILSNWNNIHQECYKFRCELQSFLGFKYLVKSEVEFKDVVTIVDVNLSKENVADYLDRNFMDGAAILGNKCWRLFIFKNPVNRSNTGNKPEHLVVIVMNHCIGDGISLSGLLTKCINGLEPITIKHKLKAKILPEKQCFNLDDANVPCDPFRPIKALRNYNMGKHTAFFHEDNVKYLPLIKAIKDTLNVGFIDVLIASLMNSLVTFSKKENNLLEKDFCFVNMIHLPDKNTISMIEGNFNFDYVHNRSIPMIFRLPAMFEQMSLMEKVQKLREECKKQAHFLLLLATLAKLGHLVSPLIPYFMKYFSRCILGGITNVAGLKCASIGGHKVQSVFTFISDTFQTGFILYVITIEDKLQLCIQGATPIIKSRQQLDNILTDMLKNIEQLYYEIECNLTEHK